ncbi:hypothetical protein Pmgp_01315 [Pelotomaculum propionicicum]|uniref:NAD-dependent epimerase/dehydratase domain-containing protein n=1 Tax=Pelotomaculum propionicicum TaxID=258475 RepID=A0A4Y7RSH4_9FIRM|nr:hypothetical protein Pmgp_01315 [Pelotomaculum propionicicum]
MNVLIFGGTGFIGRNLTEELLASGYQVFVVTRNRQRTANSLGSKVKVIEWDNNFIFWKKLLTENLMRLYA